MNICTTDDSFEHSPERAQRFSCLELKPSHLCLPGAGQQTSNKGFYGRCNFDMNTYIVETVTRIVGMKLKLLPQKKNAQPVV